MDKFDLLNTGGGILIFMAGAMVCFFGGRALWTAWRRRNRRRRR